MQANKFILGIHYHQPFYADGKGNFWVVYFVGSWIYELSKSFKEVVYIAHSTKIKTDVQDYLFQAPKNIKFVSLGPIGNIFTLPLRVYRTKKTIKNIEDYLNGIIVRAPTPRQWTLLSAYGGENKALYLVGEPAIYPFTLKNLIKLRLKGTILNLLNYRRRRQTEKLARQCLLVSNSMELCEKYKGITGKKTYYCPSSSTNEKDFYFVEDRCNNEKLHLLFVGRVCRDKGIVELLEAVSLLKKRGYKFILNVIGGSGDADKIDEFMLLAKKMEVSDVVFWRGRIQYGEELLKYYRLSDIFILPSSHEGFPHVLVEALAMGVLMVVTKVGGIGYLCEDRRELYFIEKKADAIVSAIKELIENKDLRKKLIRNGYSFARTMLAGENEKLMTSILEKEWK